MFMVYRRVVVAVLVALVLASSASASSVLVRPGNTLSGIAVRFGTTAGALARVNGLDPNGVLYAGTRLRVPSSSAGRYEVKLGDTLWGLSTRFGTTVAELARHNGLNPNGALFAGITLELPRHAPVRSRAAPHDSVRRSIDRWSAYYGVDRQLVRALAWMESGFQADVVSRTGARGVMQVMPVTWAYVQDVLIGARVARTTDGNIRIGVAFLRQLLHQFRGNERLALAGYYQGPRSLRAIGMLPQTKAYVADVLALKTRL